MTVSAIPVGYPRVSPYLIVSDAAATLAFITRAFDGELLGQHTLPDGRIMHAEVRIGDSVVMVGGAAPQWPAVPAACGTMWFISTHVEDVPADELARRMSAGGA